MNLVVPASLQRLLSRHPNVQLLFHPSGYPPVVRRVPPPVLQADFMDTRPVVFRSEAFAEDLHLSHATA